MNFLDIILAIPLLWALYRGFKKGLVYMLASLAALILGVLGAIRFHAQTGELLQRWFEIDPSHLNLLSFAVTFIVIVIVIHVAAFLADKLIKAVALNLVNRLAGMAVGVLISSFVISIILQPVDVANKESGFLKPETLEGSLLYEPIKKIAPFLLPYLKREEFRNLLPGKQQEVDEPEEDGSVI